MTGEPSQKLRQWRIAHPETMTVIVRDHDREAATWGSSGPWSPALKTVEISVKCPECGGRRGEVRGHNQREDGVSFHVNVWANPCGHIDYYASVIHEAKVRIELLATSSASWTTLASKTRRQPQ